MLDASGTTTTRMKRLALFRQQQQQQQAPQRILWTTTMMSFFLVLLLVLAVDCSVAVAAHMDLLHGQHQQQHDHCHHNHHHRLRTFLDDNGDNDMPLERERQGGRKILAAERKHHHHHYYNKNNHHEREHCGTTERTPDQTAAFERITQRWRKTKHLQRHLQQQQQQDGFITTLPVCFHIVRPTREANTDSSSKDLNWNTTFLQAQLDHLNLGFSDASCCDTAAHAWCNRDIQDCSIETGIRFAMALLTTVDDDSKEKEGEVATNSSSVSETTTSTTATAATTTTTVFHPNACITHSYNDTWYAAAVSSTQEYQMMQSLRQGDASVLNIYYNDVRGPYGQEKYLLGHATFPEWYSLYSDLDGVVVSQYAVVNDTDPEQYKYGVSTTTTSTNTTTTATTKTKQPWRLSIALGISNFFLPHKLCFWNTLIDCTGHAGT